MENKPNKAMLNLQIQMEMDKIRDLLPHFLEQQKLNAKVHRARFNALVNEGFSEAQALEIVGKRPLFE